METVSAPPAPPDPIVPPAEVPVAPSAGAADAAPEEAPRAAPARATRVRVEEPPPTGRELLTYLAMVVAGALITVATLWFYRLIQ